MSRVLVTGAGGPAGVSLVVALVERGHHVVALDADPLAAGFHLAPDAAVITSAAQPERFVADLRAAAAKFDADAIVLTVGEELEAVAAAGPDDLGTAAWIPTTESLATCQDKWRFWTHLSAAGLPVAPTARGARPDEVAALAGPWIVKPRRGRGSRDVFAVDRPDELAWACGRMDEPIVQTRAEGREFTVDALLAHDGRVAGAVPRWRLETRAGITTKGRTFRDDAVIEAAVAVAEATGVQGLVNVQGFRRDDGSVVIIEVNPRPSGGLPLSLAAGSDLAGEYLRGVLGQEIRPERLAFREDLTMIRHFAEVYVG